MNTEQKPSELAMKCAEDIYLNRKAWGLHSNPGMAIEVIAAILDRHFNAERDDALVEALREMVDYDDVGCVCPNEDIRRSRPCSTCKARAVLARYDDDPE